MPMFHVSDEDVAEFKKLRAAFLAASKKQNDYAFGDDYEHKQWKKLFDAEMVAFRQYEDFCLAFTISLLTGDE